MIKDLDDDDEKSLVKLHTRRDDVIINECQYQLVVGLNL